ncbi:MAG: signal peptide peptidase SppA [Candidatus Korobacteraceae bacterium]
MENEARSRTWLWVLIGGAAFAVFVLAIFTLVYVTIRGERDGSYRVTGGSGGKIGIVKVEGVILDPEETVRDLRKFADDKSVKVIILHLNTPGGGAAASEEIYREVRRVRDEKKKYIAASIETVGASGGYYIASGTNKIYANEASIVGSIGVIMEWVNYGELLRWAKLSQVLIKAGELKDVGNPARPMTPEERVYLQGLADNMHSQFISAVAAGRGVDAQQIRPIATGKVWTGQQALDLKLVDQIADFRGAVMDTAKAVGIEGEPSLLRPEKERRTLVDLFFGDASSLLPEPANLLQQNPGFYYLWK